jgi:glycosyltransferase involved in cell wall biosynthesis
MKVILVTSYLKSRGGVARYVSGFADYLASKNDEVIIVSLFTDRNLYVDKKNIKFIDLANEDFLPQKIQFWTNIKKIQQKFEELIDKENPDAILFNDFPATLWSQKFQKIPNLCYTHDIHMLYTDTYINNLSTITRWLWRILRIFVRKQDKKKWKTFDQIICNSQYMANYIMKTYKTKTDVIYVGTDTNVFQPPQDAIKQKVILTMGDLKVRRADFLLKACKKLAQKRNDFKIWIVGTKKDDEIFLKKLAKDLEIEKNVKFFGVINNDRELARIYSESLVLSHLVKESAFGLTAGESMSCQTPVIAWKPSGLEELIENGETGYNIEQDNEDVLITCIEKFLDHPDLSYQMGKKARKRVQKFIERDEKFQELRELLIRWSKKK